MTPRYYQQESHDAAWRYLASEPGNPLIVLPTGAGKSIVIAMLARQALQFGARVIVLQHSKELIQQNAEKIQLLLPNVRIGVNSAGLRQSAFDEDIVCAGIQSVYRKAHEFGRRELVIIDEVHLVGERHDSMYGQFIKDLKSTNARARLTGLTATPFRLGEGPICGANKTFQKICYEAFTGDLIREGFLCPITNKSVFSVDTFQIPIRGGEFINSGMEKAFNSGDTVELACAEIVAKCHDRHSVLVFCAGVDHAEHVAETLRRMTGERVGVVTGNTGPLERAAYLADFKEMRLRWIVNCDVLTTGFDAPCIDALVVLRATMSPGLFSQIVGRGLRKHESKTDCLVLDFGGNISRHGSIDNPNYGRASLSGDRKSTDSNGRGKQCINCEIDVAANAKKCPECGFLFPREIRDKHGTTADEESTLTGVPDPETWEVISCRWSIHTKRNAPKDAPRTLRVDYIVKPVGAGDGNLTQETISEWICFEHEGFARTKASLWWQARSVFTVPETIEEAVSFLDNHVARVPSRITTQVDGKFKRITMVDFVDDIPSESEWAQGDATSGYVPDFLSDDIDLDEVPF